MQMSPVDKDKSQSVKRALKQTVTSKESIHQNRQNPVDENPGEHNMLNGF